MATATLAAPGKYLAFVLAGEEYALPVLRVREIIELMDITQVPQVPPYLKGVINLRGKVIPIVDLRLRFGFAPGDATGHACIVVVDAELNGGRGSLGFIVDGVAEVLNIAAGEIEETPDFGDRATADFVQGIAKRDARVTMLLDLDRIVSAGAEEARA